MNYTVVSVQAEDQALNVNNMPKLASGGSDEVKIIVEFDAMWEDLKKTAVFYRKFGSVYHIELDEENSAIVPYEVTKTKGTVYFGVVGENGEGAVRTSEVIALDIVQGAAIEKEAGYEPAPDIYAEILAAAKNAEAIAQSVRDDADAGAFGGGTKVPEALPNPFAITINGVRYDGSKPVEVNIETETDMSAYYTKAETDAMFGSYITDIDALIGGEV